MIFASGSASDWQRDDRPLWLGVRIFRIGQGCFQTANAFTFADWNVPACHDTSEGRQAALRGDLAAFLHLADDGPAAAILRPADAKIAASRAGNGGSGGMMGLLVAGHATILICCCSVECQSLVL